jgi:hypothetical protein
MPNAVRESLWGRDRNFDSGIAVLRETPDSPEDSAGNPSLKGWVYQSAVSAWAALDLCLAKRLTEVLFLEPPSEEDVEADIDPPRGSSRADLAGMRLVVQAKYRHAGASWTEAAFTALLKHGKYRTPAATRLNEDGQINFVLVTNAGAQDGAGNLLIEDDLVEPAASTALPTFLKDVVSEHAAGRLAILGLQSLSRIRERIKTLLMLKFSVPLDNCGGCIQALEAEAMARMASGRPWLRSEIEVFVQEAGGQISAGLSAPYVQPNNWQILFDQLIAHNILVLRGPSGSGKTSTANELAKALAKRIPGLNVVGPIDSPEEIRHRVGEGPTLFLVEDPWGKYDLSSRGVNWTKGLEQLCTNASRQQMLLVTTRTDILMRSGTDSKILNHWARTLDAGSYRGETFGKLFEQHAAGLENNTYRSAASRWKSTLLNALSSPLEIARFFAEFKFGPRPGEKEVDLFNRVIQSAQEDAIENEVKLQIEARQATHWATIIWGLMHAWGKLPRDKLPTVRRALSRKDPGFRDGLDNLVNELVAADMLRQPGPVALYAHPRVELGLFNAMKGVPGQTENNLEMLLEVLKDQDSLSPDALGIAGAARLAAAMLDVHPAIDVIPPAVQSAIDAWLMQALALEQDDFPALMRLAALVGSKKCVAGELARYFRPGKRDEGFFMPHWSEPDWSTDQWYADMRAQTATSPICSQFIRKILRVESQSYPFDLADYIERLTSDAAPAFVESVNASLRGDWLPNATALAYGAMRAPADRETLLDHAIEVQPDGDFNQQDLQDMWRAAEDGHYNEDDEPYDSPPDPPVYEEVIEAYVDAARRENTWDALSSHRHAAILIPVWGRILREERANDVVAAEVIAAFEAAYALGKREGAWQLAVRMWQPVLEDLLADALTEAPNNERDAWNAAMHCALQHCPNAAISAMNRHLHARDVGRALALVLAALDIVERYDDFDASYEQIKRALPGEIRAVAECFSKSDQLSSSAIKDGPLATCIALMTATQGRLQAQVTWLATISNHVNPEIISQLLAEIDDVERAKIGFHCAKQAGLWDLIQTSLQHERADVRQLALEALVERDGGQISPELKSLVWDKGNRVRAALLEALARHPNPADFDTYLTLCADTWCNDIQSAQENDISLPIARRAAEVVAGFASIPSAYSSRILGIANVTGDVRARQTLLDALARSGDDEIRAQLFAQMMARPVTRDARDAARALCKIIPTLPAGLIGQLTADILLRTPRSIVGFLALLVGRDAPVESLLDIAQVIAANPKRRILLLPLATGARHRSTDVSASVVDLLPVDHPARLVEVAPPHSAPKLPTATLDDLGEPLLVNVVAGYYPNYFEKRPNADA